jgi:hypothetical protein
MRLGPVRSSRLVKAPTPNAGIEPFRDGFGVLTRDGEIAGYIATTVLQSWSPLSPLRLRWWVWYIVIWADGTRERKTEDYPPWSAVDEMMHGYFEWETPRSARNGRYEFVWLESERAASARASFGITAQDF